MRLSISNIAWSPAEEETVAAMLAERGIDRVDLVPGRYFPDPELASAADVAAVRRLWADRGFAVEGLQSLLFGTTGFNLFQAADGAMLRRLAAVCRIGGGLGARALTFGSPRQRDRSGLDEPTAERIAVDFFRELGDHASAADVTVCLEPTPAVYNCNFMLTTSDAARIVAAVGHPAIRLQLDTGALTLNREPVAETIAAVAPLIGHVHASEPMLATLDGGSACHAEAALALGTSRPDLTVTIEMAFPTTEPTLSAVARAVDVAQSTYGATG